MVEPPGDHQLMSCRVMVMVMALVIGQEYSLSQYHAVMERMKILGTV